MQLTRILIALIVFCSGRAVLCADGPDTTSSVSVRPHTRELRLLLGAAKHPAVRIERTAGQSLRMEALAPLAPMLGFGYVHSLAPGRLLDVELAWAATPQAYRFEVGVIRDPVGDVIPEAQGVHTADLTAFDRMVLQLGYREELFSDRRWSIRLLAGITLEKRLERSDNFTISYKVREGPSSWSVLDLEMAYDRTFVSGFCGGIQGMFMLGEKGALSLELRAVHTGRDLFQAFYTLAPGQPQRSKGVSATSGDRLVLAISYVWRLSSGA